jgi:nitrogenase molybdenum-iron protein NifN
MQDCREDKTMIQSVPVAPRRRVASENACKLCAPLGASLVFSGVEGTVSFLHGSQGCATYIRRYMISHFKEPVDIASSNFSEDAAVFGGKRNLLEGIRNVCRQYAPAMIGVATTCLAETIGDDLKLFLHELQNSDEAAHLPPIVHVSTPSYSGTHAEGYHATVRSLVEYFAPASCETDVVPARLPESEKMPRHRVPAVNLFPGIVSPADLRHLREIVEDFGHEAILVPDFSDPLDGPAWDRYHLIPPGGTPIEQLRRVSEAKGSLELTRIGAEQHSPGRWLEEHHRVSSHRPGMPIGVLATDEMFDALEAITGRPTPKKHIAERGRLIDSYVDSHKYLFDRRAIVYGEEDLVVGIASFLAEIGIVPAVCASGGKSGRLEAELQRVTESLGRQVLVVEGVDFEEIEQYAEVVKPHLILGNSKGYKLSQKLGVPLIRIGFPIHDRIGGSRLLHLGYRGAQQLFDRVTNALIERKQSESPVGYTYM